jgi:hypothetical protein
VQNCSYELSLGPEAYETGLMTEDDDPELVVLRVDLVACAHPVVALEYLALALLMRRLDEAASGAVPSYLARV